MPENDPDTHGLVRLASSLRRWENEGGATPSAPAGVDPDLQATERHLLRSLGAAVVLHWNNLPTPVQRDLFESAASMDDPASQEQLVQELGRYLHHHKGHA